MRYVWEVRATGGDPQKIKKAVERGLDKVRAGKADLSDFELDAWRTIEAVSVIDVATADGATSVLVEIETSDSEEALLREAVSTANVGALLSGGFDTAVLDEVMDVDGVMSAEHSDRIDRP